MWLRVAALLVDRKAEVAFVVVLLSMFALDTLRAHPADTNVNALEMAESPAASRRLG
jgi:hypothetical protein